MTAALSPELGGLFSNLRGRVEDLERIRFPSGSVGFFNAVIDPGFPSTPSTHVYENLTELLAGESWGTDQVFLVGVYNRPGTPIVEPVASPTIPGHLALVAFGAHATGWSIGGDGSRARWNLNGTRFIGISSVISIYGIEMFNDSASAQNDIFRSSQVVHLYDSIVHGFDDSNVRKISVVTDGPITANDTLFMGIVFTNVVTATDCHYTWANDGSTVTIFAADVHWDGGTLSGVFGGNTLRLVNSSGTDFYIRMVAVVTTQITGSAGSNATIQLSAGSGTLDLQCQDAGKPFDLVVDAGMGNAEIRGDFRNITDGGVSSGDRRRYDVTCQQTADITGPAQVRIQFTSTAGRLTLRGSGLQVDAHGQLNTSGIFLTLTDADFAWVVATCSGNGGTSQFYAIDAASASSVVVAMGDPASFGSASTNGSGSTIVRDAASL